MSEKKTIKIAIAKGRPMLAWVSGEVAATFEV